MVVSDTIFLFRSIMEKSSMELESLFFYTSSIKTSEENPYEKSIDYLCSGYVIFFDG